MSKQQSVKETATAYEFLASLLLRQTSHRQDEVCAKRDLFFLSLFFFSRSVRFKAMLSFETSYNVRETRE